MRQSNKRGILLTFGLSFLALTILSLAMIIWHNAQESEEITSKLAVFDRAYELDSSIKSSLQSLFAHGSGINVTLRDSKAVFTQLIPNPSAVSYNRSRFSFKKFVEKHINGAVINLSNSSDSISLRLDSVNILYSYNMSSNVTSITPESTPEYYEINFTFTGINVTPPSNCDLSTGSLDVRIYSEDNRGNSYSCLNGVDPSSETISVISTNEGSLIVKIYGGGNLAINSSVDGRADTSIDVGFASQPEDVIMSHPGDVLNINFADFGINKTSPVILY